MCEGPSAAPSPDWVAEAESRGLQVELLPADAARRVDLHALLALLAGRGLNHLLVEGGSALLGALNDGGLIDELQTFIAPKIVGGAAALGPVSGVGTALMAHANRFTLRRLERYDQDVLLVAATADAPWWNATEECDVHGHC